MFNKLGNFNKFTKLRKDFQKLDDKLIIQHFHHILIRTLTYMMYYSNFSTFKNTYKNLERSCKSPEGK